MKKYTVTIIETLSRTIDIEAESFDEASAEIMAKYNDEEIVLDADDFDDVQFITLED